jgi:2-amino-4-hydroxy-6-hydroxymethyldihydropteridine diphosphokinase
MILIALGGNLHGAEGPPLLTLQWAIREMAKSQLNVISISSFYRTRAVGQEEQPDYVNAIVSIQTTLSAGNTLIRLKLIEKKAGRDQRRMLVQGRWGPRLLDLDIIDYKSIVSRNFHVCSGDYHVTSGRTPGECKLVLPHPQAHLRPFVIQPIVDIHPFWHHPVYRTSAVSMAAALQNRREGQILHRISIAP